MKVVSVIFRYLFVFLLAISIIVLLSIFMLKNTLLSKEYVEKNIEKVDYYTTILNEVNSNFNKYIEQSGLDKEIFKDVVSKEKIKNDTQIILNNIYYGSNDIINTEEIENKLRENIGKTIDSGLMDVSQKKSIEDFIKEISNEYLNTVSYSNYETEIYKIYSELLQYIEIAQKILFISMIILIILLLILSRKRFFKGIVDINIAITSSGLFYTLGILYIQSKIKIDNIIILNKSVSNVIKSIMNDITEQIFKYGIILIAIGVIFIIIGNIIDIKKQEKIDT